MTSALHFADFKVKQFGNRLFPVWTKRYFFFLDFFGFEVVDNFFINVGSGFPIVLSNHFTNRANVEEQLVTCSVFCLSWTIATALSCGNRVLGFGG